MNRNKRYFDAEAATWDEAPGRIRMTGDITRSMIANLNLRPDMDVLDFGCGTGLVTFALRPYVRSVTGVDSSRGMLEAFTKKIKEGNIDNVRAEYLDLDAGDILQGSYHLIVSSMTFHHVRETGKLLKDFHRILLPSGQIAIADLDSEQGEFHGDNVRVYHFGFDREELRREFVAAGFRDVNCSTAAEVEKPVSSDLKRIRTFTIFLMTGRK
jgi:ubiquinone/menaquinone biosynthesis C-methylase UbiE